MVAATAAPRLSPTAHPHPPVTVMNIAFGRRSGPYPASMFRSRLFIIGTFAASKSVGGAGRRRHSKNRDASPNRISPGHAILPQIPPTAVIGAAFRPNRKLPPLKPATRRERRRHDLVSMRENRHILGHMVHYVEAGL